MKVVVAIDSFKGSMTSMQAGMACKEGILAAIPKADVVVRPLADGGEGTVTALVEGMNGTYEHVDVTGPMGQKVPRHMEYLRMIGVPALGCGEMILDAVHKGCRNFIIGIGGSATTEGGIGMLMALGYEFYDEDDNILPPVFGSLARVRKIKADKVPSELKQCHFKIACDVTNPLCTEQGCVYIFGKQKGVQEHEKAQMDKMMRQYADCVEEYAGKRFSETPGAGAAGGLGFAFLFGLENVELKSGIDIVLNAIQLDKELKNADIVVTGEGRLDGQSAMGKVPVGVAKAGRKNGCKVIALAGSVTDDAVACNKEGIDAFFPIIRGATTLNEAMDIKNAQKNMKNTAEQVFRLIDISSLME